MDLSELKPLLLVQDKRLTVYKVLHHYPDDRVSVQVVFENDEVPTRTTVRAWNVEDIKKLRIKPASSRMVHKYEDAWGLAPWQPSKV